MNLLMALKGIAQADSQAAIEHDRVSHETALAATRESHKSNMEIMMLFMSQARPPVAPAVDPALAAILAQLAQGQQALTLALANRNAPDDDDDEDDDEPTEEEKLAQLMVDMKAEGFPALMRFAKEESMEGFINAFPFIKQKFPEMMAFLMPFIQEKLAAMGLPIPAGAPAGSPVAFQTNGSSVTVE